jgi:hypothetical protein
MENKIKNYSEKEIECNKKLLSLTKENKNLKFSISISGILIENLEKYSPFALLSFSKLKKSRRVEFTSQTYYNSHASILSKKEFVNQINMQNEILEKHFGVKKITTFNKSKDMLSKKSVSILSDLGFKSILTSGKSFYKKDANGMKIISCQKGSNHNLIEINNNTDVDKDIEQIKSDLNKCEYIRSKDISKKSPKSTLKFSTVNIKKITTNTLQQHAIKSLYDMEPHVLALNDSEIKKDWQTLTSLSMVDNMHIHDNWRQFDNVNQMRSPYEEYSSYMNCLNDLAVRINKKMDENYEFDKTQITENPITLINNNRL